MPGGRKIGSLKATNSSIRSTFSSPGRTCRNGSGPVNTANTSGSPLITAGPLYHFPHPNLPVSTSMGFESLFLSYLLCALALQYVIIYKVNVHMIDVHLVVFVVISLSRRIAWNVLQKELSSEVLYTVKHFMIAVLKGVALLSLLTVFAWLLWKLFQQNSGQNCLFLCYPLVIYLVTFGLTMDPQGSKVILKLSTHQELSTASQIQLSQSQTQDKQVVTNGSPRPESTVTMQQCSLPPDAVRYEAECLRTDFNMRVKQVLFQSLVCAYYVGFIPMIFAEEHHIYYDLWWACQHILFVWLSCVLMLATFLLPLSYCDALHKCAMHLGSWERCDPGHRETPHIWSSLTVWPEGVLVRHGKSLYRALGEHNVALPGDPHHGRFFFMFESPLRLINWMACVLLLLVLYQLFLLVRCYHWHQVLSITGMLAFNYVVLYRICRNRWAMQAVLKERGNR